MVKRARWWGLGYNTKRSSNLLNQRGYTLPSLGLIMEQSIAGATATGTHSSGKHCLSGYLVQDLKQVLDFEPDYPQQQFYLLPFRWDHLVQLRRESSQQTNWLTYLHRWHWYLTVDVALHVVLIVCWSWLRSRSLLSSFYRWLVPVVLIRHWQVIDQSPQLLTMDHDLFRHIEVEVFVPRSQLSASLSFVQQLLQFAAGERQAFDPPTWQRLVDGQQLGR